MTDTTGNVGLKPIRNLMGAYEWSSIASEAFRDYQWHMNDLVRHPVINALVTFIEANERLEREAALHLGYDPQVGAEGSMERLRNEFKNGRVGRRLEFDPILGAANVEIDAASHFRSLFAAQSELERASGNTVALTPAARITAIQAARSAEEMALSDVENIGKCLQIMHGNAINGLNQLDSDAKPELRELLQVRIDVLEKAAAYAKEVKAVGLGEVSQLN